MKIHASNCETLKKSPSANNVVHSCGERTSMLVTEKKINERESGLLENYVVEWFQTSFLPYTCRFSILLNGLQGYVRVTVRDSGLMWGARSIDRGGNKPPFLGSKMSRSKEDRLDILKGKKDTTNSEIFCLRFLSYQILSYPILSYLILSSLIYLKRNY